RRLRRVVRRRQHRHRGRGSRRLWARRGVGVHPQWRRLDATGEAGRNWRRRRPRPLRRVVRRRQHRHRGRESRQPGGRRGVWFTRSGGVWTQQGPKLVGTGAVGPVVQQGFSVALSADGDTAMVGGPSDDGNTGAVWVFTRSGGVWTQQGNKLVGSGAVGGALQGFSVALSGDGNTTVVGGNADNSNAGAAWVFTRSDGVWSQQGCKLVGTGAVNSPLPAQQGRSVALSTDGNTAILGGPADNTNAGAAWVFAASPNPGPRTAAHDFNGDCV